MDRAGNPLTMIYRKCVKDHGAAGDGTTADDSAINSTIAAETEILFTAGTYRITANATWAAGKVYRFVPGAKLTIDSGVTLTIRGLVDAAPASLFIGSGTVTGIRNNFAEWFGAVRNGSTDDAPAIQKAINSGENSSSSDGGEVVLELLYGTYAIASTLTFQPAGFAPWRVRGSGSQSTLIKAKASFRGSYAIAFGRDAVCDYTLSDFGVQNQTAGSGPTNGLYVGTSSGTLQGTQESRIENIYVTGFAVNYLIQNLRLVQWNTCSSWNADSVGTEVSGGTGCLITAQASSFCGDMDFYSCQFVGRTSSPNGKCVSIDDAGRRDSHVAGIRFHACIFYGASQQVYMSCSGSNAGHGDIWFKDGCQFEGPAPGTGIAIDIFVTGSTASIIHVFVHGCYFAGNGFSKCFEATTFSGGQIFNYQITGNFMSTVLNEFVDIRGSGSSCYGMMVNDNWLRSPVANAVASAIYIKDCKQSNANGNIMCEAGSRSYIVKFDGPTGDYITAVGNNTGGLAVAGTVTNAGRVAHTNFSANI